MNTLKYGSPAVGAPGSFARAYAEYKDVVDASIRYANAIESAPSFDEWKRVMSLMIKEQIEKLEDCTRLADGETQ